LETLFWWSILIKDFGQKIIPLLHSTVRQKNKKRIREPVGFIFSFQRLKNRSVVLKNMGMHSNSLIKINIKRLRKIWHMQSSIDYNL